MSIIKCTTTEVEKYVMSDDVEKFMMTDKFKLFEEKCEKMNALFPKLPFDADTDHLDILDEVIAKNKDVIIYHKHNKFYYSNFPTTPVELIYIKRDRHITYRDVYLECEAKWIHDCGNHRFLEGINVYNDTQIELCFGS